MKTSEKPGYEPFPEISGSRSCLIVSAAACISLSRPSKDLNDIDFIPTIFEDKKEEFEYP